MRGLSVCSGIGGLDIAAEVAGIRLIGQIEIDMACQAVLAKHWPDVPRYGDIRLLHGNEFDDVDILFGGIPCQPYSIAGRRRAADDKRDLWSDTFLLIRGIRPRWVLIENVANFAHLGLDRVWSDMAAEGYEVGAAVLPACAFGAPHKRERCFVVAHANQRHVCALHEIQAGRDASGVCGDALADTESLTAGSQDDEAYPFTAAWDARPLPLSGSQRVQPAEGLPQSRLGRAVDGVAERLDEYRQSCCTALAHSGPTGFQGDVHWRGENGQGPDGRSSADNRRPRLPQPRLDRAVDGITRQLDAARWPVKPGVPQASWEAPRIVAAKLPGHHQRLRQLGNAVVWQQAYPLFALIVALDETDEDCLCV